MSFTDLPGVGGHQGSPDFNTVASDIRNLQA